MDTKHTLPTIADVAELAGVSIATVSRVINGTAPVVEETAQRVHNTITIGLLFSKIGGAFFPHLLKGIEAETRAGGYELLIHSTRSQQMQKHRSLGEHNIDGLLVFTSSLAMDELRRLGNINFPVVLMHRASPENLNIPVITIQNKKWRRSVGQSLD